MDKYLLSAEEIESLEGLEKVHFLNTNGRRRNKSLGDHTGLKAIGFHIIEVPPGAESTESHVHHIEEECVYVLAGEGEAELGDEKVPIKPGDFIGYRAGGLHHLLRNTGTEMLRCIVVGQRLSYDVADYPRRNKRLYRAQGMPWNLVDLEHISQPSAGRKV